MGVALLAAALAFLLVMVMWSRPPWPGVQVSLPLMSFLAEKSLSVFDQNRREAYWQACGLGSKIEVSVEVESKKRWNSLMSDFPSMVLSTSLEACPIAIISASWFDARLANRTLREKTTWPAWMPMTAQPTALSVFEPLVKMFRVLRPSLVVSQMRWLAIRFFQSSLGQADRLMNNLPANGREESL